ncbi:MAG: DUF4142 domain-containing protein [Myxacorys chilensis ATA2-1-KO14]|jgi:putative membrane protein|nr:DUF4142 domain-containing protein [Myxacorys chilensis ATA2-1-KO14]
MTIFQKHKVRKIAGSLSLVGVGALFGIMGLPHTGLKTHSPLEADSLALAQAPTSPSSPRAPQVDTSPRPRPATPAKPATPGSRVSPAATRDIDTKFAIKAAQSDQTEIQTSQLALQKSTNPNVRQYAERMIRDHTTSSQRLMPVAMKKGITLPKDVGPLNRPLLTELSQLSGADFDRAYIVGQVRGHAGTQAEYQTYLREGRDANLKALANQFLPIVSDHLEMAQNMAAKGF